MKKYFIVLAALALVFAGCKPTEGGSSYTSISFKEKSLTLEIGQTEKLHVRWEPTSITTAPECTFVSSNEEVVTVDENGNVTAVAAGEANVTAKHGDLTAVCPITVKSIQDMLEWAGWTIWNFDSETPLCDPVDIELSIGTVKCVMYPATAFVWDQNISPVYEGKNMTGLSGEGFVLEVINMPIYIIDEGDYKGHYVGSSYLSIVDPAQFNPNDTAFAYCAPAGKVGDAAKWYDMLTNEESTYEYTDAFTGTELSIIDWDNNKRYYWFGLGGTGIYAGDETEVYYRSNVTWFENRYGLKLNEAGDDFVQPAVWGEMTEKFYEKLPDQSAKKELKPMKMIRRETPKFDRKVVKMDKNVLIKK